MSLSKSSLPNTMDDEDNGKPHLIKIHFPIRKTGDFLSEKGNGLTPGFKSQLHSNSSVLCILSHNCHYSFFARNSSLILC